jgi:hypothetical protein
MIFNGAPSFVASMQKDAAYGQIIEFLPDDDQTVKISNTGFPSSTGVFVKLGDSEETAKQVETKDPSGRKVLLKMWHNAETNELISKGYNIADKVTSSQFRKVNDDGVLTLTITNLKDSDKSTCSFYAKFKKLM